ncbi:MAG TPA: hypothetical protein VFS26_11170 [Solirubrobacterales bacterium]|nr:hypothetical protein [Solirubrobacterales bacterium]
MRKALIGSVVAVSVLSLVGASSLAGSGPRLNGTFQVTGTVLNNDIGIPEGTEITDVFVFKSTCGGTGGCAKAVLTRKSGGRNFKSTLKRKAPGVYKGTEGPYPYTCVDPIGTKGQFTGQNKITVTKAKKGKAIKISGKLVDRYTGCNETVEEATVTGRLTR